jgi:uncharacterized protein (TIGR00369 family)
VSCDAEKKEMVFDYTVAEWEANPAGLLHGGVMSLMLDVTLAALIAPYVGGFTPTIQLTVTFLRPVPIGETLRIHAKVISIGKNVAHAEGEATLLTGKLVATGKGIYSVNTWKSKLGEVDIHG